jgi:Flp pilus assembly protein TadG
MMMRSKNRQQGSLAVELALLLLALVPLTFGITEYGRAIYQYNAIAKGVRDGVRYLNQYAPGDPDRISKAKCLVVYGNAACTGVVLVTGLTEGMVTVRDSVSDTGYKLQSTGRGAVNLVQVEVAGYVFNSFATFMVSNLTFAPISATMVQAP